MHAWPIKSTQCALTAVCPIPTNTKRLRVGATCNALTAQRSQKPCASEFSPEAAACKGAVDTQGTPVAAAIDLRAVSCAAAEAGRPTADRWSANSCSRCVELAVWTLRSGSMTDASVLQRLPARVKAQCSAATPHGFSTAPELMRCYTAYSSFC